MTQNINTTNFPIFAKHLMKNNKSKENKNIFPMVMTAPYHATTVATQDKFKWVGMFG